MFQKYEVCELYCGFVEVNCPSNNNFLYFTLLRKGITGKYFDLKYPSRDISSEAIPNTISYTVYCIEPLSNYSNLNILTKRQAMIEANNQEKNFESKKLVLLNNKHNK